MDARSIATLFKNDLWKDQRTIEILASSEGKALIKHYPSALEKQTEISISKFLNGCGLTGIPPISPIISEDGLAAEMPYFEGIRLFNLFVALDAIRYTTNGEAATIKKQLIEKCEKRQKELQGALIQWRAKQDNRIPYPQSKLYSIIEILSYCLKLRINRDDLAEETERINEYFSHVATVPFRDSTTKNMILNCPELFTEHFQSDNERDSFIQQCILDKSYIKWLDAPIIDIDFCSCVHDTTYEDDVISLKFHERTWNGMIPEAESLLWNGIPDNQRAAITFLIRYFRFGGRKAAYRLLHASGHCVRFKYDNDCFYFMNLPKFIQHLWPEFKNLYPNMFSFIVAVARNLPFQNEPVDIFMEYFPDIFEKSNYYTDVFPY